MKYNINPLSNYQNIDCPSIAKPRYNSPSTIGPLTTVEYGLFGNQDFNSNHG